MTAGTTISLHGIYFRYNGSGSDVLRNVSMDIPAAAATGILGPNGSGKTTLLAVLLGMLSPRAGTLHIDGERQKCGPRQRVRQMIGWVPQDEYFPLGFTVLDYVLLGRAPHLGLLERPRASDYEVAEQAMERAGISALSGRLVPSLSGGERQLAAIARGLAQEPRVLLMDEPTSHLDLRNRGHIIGLIRSLVSKGVTVVFTTHDPNAAIAAAHSVVLMREGQIIATGPVETVITTESLAAAYGTRAEVVHVHGRPVVLAA